jgi:V8-like Glu-specific endopeptidase
VLKIMTSTVFVIINLLMMSKAFGAFQLGLSHPQFFPKIIYGTDNRYETDDYPDRQFREYAKSVAAMVASNDIFNKVGDPTTKRFRSKTAKQRFGLCDGPNGERFASQKTLSHCTAFLVAPDLMVTAGHCVLSDFECKKRFKWVFDFKGEGNTLKTKNIYSCVKIVGRKFSESKTKIKDYAIIKLNRPVKGRAPLKYRKRRKVKKGTPLVMIGHPLMLSQKIADQGTVLKKRMGLRILSRIKRKNYFLTDLDSYIGNSGSPVFNQNTGLIEGILISGAEDLVFNKADECYRSKVRGHSPKTAEEMVYRITKVKGLPAQQSALQHIPPFRPRRGTSIMTLNNTCSRF